jgi:6-pyruvoyltetrahydropterin/6-carboxytetrahydropterin synthase
VVIDRVPTVENLAKIAFDVLQPVYHGRYGHQLSLTKVTLYETPNCWAEIDD